MGDDAVVRVAVLADTHVRGGIDRLPVPVVDRLAGVDVILHAGDVVSPELLAGLADLAPTHTVLGNNDHELVGLLPDRLELRIGGVAVAMVHDSGARAGRPARLRRWFPEAQLVVFGHSHDPVDEVGVEGQWLFNPGSPTQRRRQPFPTMGTLELAGGRIVSHRVDRVDAPG
jgi:uncharacterized protein